MTTPASRTIKPRDDARPKSWPAKDADEVVDYAIDFSARIGPCDSLASALFSLATAAGLTIDRSETSCNTAIVWLSSGTAGEKGKILCRVTTTEGRTFDETVSLLVRAR